VNSGLRVWGTVWRVTGRQPPHRVPVLGKHDVFWFDASEDDAAVVQVHEPHSDPGNIERHPFGGEVALLLALELQEQLAALAPLQQGVQVLLATEASEHLGQKGAVHRAGDLTLAPRRLLMPVLLDKRARHPLHGERALGRHVLHQRHAPEGPHPQGAQGLKVVEVRRVLPRGFGLRGSGERGAETLPGNCGVQGIGLWV